MDKEDVIHTHTQGEERREEEREREEYHSAIKKNEILPFATTQMDLEGIMVGEISQRKTNTI